MMGADNNEFAVETVETGAADLSTTYPATIRGVQDVEIRAKVSGNIVRQLVDEGDFRQSWAGFVCYRPHTIQGCGRSGAGSREICADGHQNATTHGQQQARVATKRNRFAV